MVHPNVAHPAQGEVVAWIYRYSDDDAIGLEQDFHDSRYRKMLLRAWAAAAAYSVQWKLGPLSEVTIGHVGLHTDPTYGTNRTGLNDYVLNSSGGIPLMIVEDAGDRYAPENGRRACAARPQWTPCEFCETLRERSRIS